MRAALLLSLCLQGACALTYVQTTHPPVPAWTQAVDFALGSVAAAAAVWAFNASPEHDGALGALIVAETFWWSSAFAEGQ